MEAARRRGLVLLVATVSTACVSDPPALPEMSGSGSAGSGSAGSGSASTMRPPTPTATTVEDTTDTATSQGTTTMVGPTSGDSTDTGDDPFVFDATPLVDYVQVDRQGFPAVNTGLNLLGDKDAYNAASPADDATLMFVGNILESLETLHLGEPMNQVANNTGLDDDLLALGFQPCVTPPLPMDNCEDQAGPFVLPDIIEIDLNAPGGFPNGRLLADPVMDIILAVLLLDLGAHALDTFIDPLQNGSNLSFNPMANDVPFQADFPYLASPH